MIFNNNKGLVIEIWLKMNKLALSGFVCIVNDMAYSDMSIVFRISAYFVVGFLCDVTKKMYHA